MNQLNKLVSSFIDIAESLGLSAVDIKNAKDLLEYREYGLAFDTVITQLYEYEVEISSEVYEYIKVIAEMMNMPENEFSFMKELIETNNRVPKPVRDKLVEVLEILKNH